MNRPMSILAFVPSLGGGGAEKHVERIANAVDRRIATIDVATVRPGGSFERFLDASIAREALRPMRIRSGTAELLASMPALRARMTSGRYDAVLAFLERPSIAALLVASTVPRHRRPKIVLSVQADPVSIVRQDPLGPAFGFAMRHLYRRADAVIAISNGVRDALRGFDAALDPIVVPNACIDDHLRAAIARPLPRPTEPTVVACGRLTEQKGFDLLIDAFAEVRRAIPSARLRIVGTGPLESELRGRALRLGLASAVTFVGFVDEPVRELAAADVFCLSSRFEGLGMVLVEAMAAGTAVVSTDCPYGPRDILEDGRHGVLVPVDDPGALAEGLVALLRDPIRREALARSGRKRAQDFDAAAVAAAYVNVIAGLVG